MAAAVWWPPRSRWPWLPGWKILAAGGNAADAAVATAAALNVTEPTSTGIGGDCFALFYEAATRQVTALNGSGRAPAALDPGAPAARRPWAASCRRTTPTRSPCRARAPAGATWSSVTAACRSTHPGAGHPPGGRGLPGRADHGLLLGSAAPRRQLRSAPSGQELTIDGRGPRAGEIFRNPGLARTFRAVAEGGKAAFYEGEIAEAIAADGPASGRLPVGRRPGGHHSTWDEPISTTYRGLRIWECPPNGQGLAALLALNMLEGFDLAALRPLSPERLHLEIEAMRLAFADTRWYVADPAFSPAPLDELLSKDYAAERRSLIDPGRATLDQRHGAPVAGSDTVYFSVVDGEGNACSFINSNYMGFGTGIVPPGWGFSLQNRGHNFSLDPAHPNALAPGKRPYHTIIPAHGHPRRRRRAVSPASA